MKIWISSALCVGILAGCDVPENRVSFEGHRYNSRIHKIERQLDQFTVTVKPVSHSLLGARQAGEYKAIVYCVNAFGSSDIVWAAGPDAPEGQLNIDKDTLTLQGRCPNAR